MPRQKIKKSKYEVHHTWDNPIHSDYKWEVVKVEREYSRIIYVIKRHSNHELLYTTFRINEDTLERQLRFL